MVPKTVTPSLGRPGLQDSPRAIPSGRHIRLASAAVEERLLRALVSKEHQGILRRALGYLVREHPVVVPAVHPLPHVLGADAEAGTPLLPAELATVEVAERDAPLVRSVFAPVVVADLSREVLIDLRAGELITERLRLAPKQIPQLLTARLLIRRKTVGYDGLVEAMGVSWRPGFGGLCPA